MSISNRGGWKLSEETKSKISQTLKGRMPKNIEFIKNYWKGRKRTLENCIKMSKLKKGVKQTKKAIKARSEALRGHKVSLETAIKISKALKGKPQPWNTGNKHHAWLNGKSFEKYTEKWTDEFRDNIRQRDKYTCQICGKKRKVGDRKLAVHHIDYNKKNLSQNNLISLCISCHMKTGFHRKYWIRYFNQFFTLMED